MSEVIKFCYVGNQKKTNYILSEVIKLCYVPYLPSFNGLMSKVSASSFLITNKKKVA
jgi:hypothetical protein